MLDGQMMSQVGSEQKAYHVPDRRLGPLALATALHPACHPSQAFLRDPYAPMPTDVPVLVKMAVLTPMTLPEESCRGHEGRWGHGRRLFSEPCPSGETFFHASGHS